MPELPDYLMPVPGTPYVVLKNDTRLAPWAIANGSIKAEWEIEKLPCVQALDPNDVVLDIGAFIGDTATIFREKGAEVWAFEPYPDAFAALRINCPTVHALNVAVGDGSPMHASGLFGEHNGNHGTRMVSHGGTPSIRIDDLRLNRVTFIKLDVEGCEPMALDGMRETLRRFRPKLVVEVYDTLLLMQGYTRRDVIDRLRQWGYELSVAVGREEDDRLDYLAVAK